MNRLMPVYRRVIPDTNHVPTFGRISEIRDDSEIFNLKIVIMKTWILGAKRQIYKKLLNVQ
ncbi:hypothetical protein PGB90_002277 [Kerria lacca]